MEFVGDTMRHQRFWFRVSCNFHQTFGSVERFSLVSFFDVEIAACSAFNAVQESFLKTS